MVATAETKPFDAIRGPKGRWLIGDILEFEKDPIGWVSANRAIYGDFVRLNKEIVLVHHPEIIHELLSMTNESTTPGNPLLEAEQKTQFDELRLDPPVWAGLRGDVGHVLHRSLIAEHLERIGSHIRTGLAGVAGRDVDLFEVTRQLAGRSIVDFCLGADGPVDGIAEAGQRAVDTSMTLIGQMADASLNLIGRPTARRWKRQEAARVSADAELMGLLGERVGRRRAARRPGRARDLLDALLLTEQPDADHQIVVMLRTIIGGANGGPPAALAWTLLRMNEHPDAFEAVRAEVKSLAHDPLQPRAKSRPDDPASRMSVLDDMPYTTALVREVLRLHPPAWLMSRKVIDPITVGGFTFPANVNILFSPYTMHRDERWWGADPSRFDPTRWMGPGKPHGRHAYVPFGSGPRFCAGAHLSLVQAVLMAAELTRYRLNFPSLSSVPVKLNSFLRPEARGSWTK